MMPKLAGNDDRCMDCHLEFTVLRKQLRSCSLIGVPWMTFQFPLQNCKFDSAVAKYSEAVASSICNDAKQEFDIADDVTTQAACLHWNARLRN